MTLGTLLIYVGIAALVLTGIIAVTSKEIKNYLISFLQNFTGSLFLVSGFVKAVDPMGTAFKMEQYFTEFQSTFEATWFSFIAPIFPVLNEYAIGFSVFMIVLELLLGLALILGAKPKWTSWVFLLLVLFFTFLTGFTYLTGYVPGEANFFEFGKWVAYEESNMKVTDCGCFGDFIKLQPKTSFFKDVFLLIPAILFVLFYKQQHQIFSPKWRVGLIVIFALGSLFYCFSNYMWSLPTLDFRPFKEGVNIAKQKEAEEEAQVNREIIGWVFENKETGEEQKIMEPDFAAAKEQLGEGEWKTVDQVQTEPRIPVTKISDFLITGEDGYEVTEDILNEEGYSFMIICYKTYLKNTQSETVTVHDTLYRVDTIMNEDKALIVKAIDTVKTREEERYSYEWSDQYIQRFNELVPFLNKASQDGHRVYAITKSAAPDQLASFKEATGLTYPVYTADDILLKTVIRSNPGIVLMKNGEIINKWHYKQLPEYDTVKNSVLE